MITYDVGQIRFNYRVVGVAVEDGHVFLHRDAIDDFWAMPGGRAELQEEAAECSAAKAEMLEADDADSMDLAVRKVQILCYN